MTLANGAHRAEPGTESEAAEDQRDAEAVRVAAYAGLRQGELLALRWRDIDWADRRSPSAVPSVLASKGRPRAGGSGACRWLTRRQQLSIGSRDERTSHHPMI